MKEKVTDILKTLRVTDTLYLFVCFSFRGYERDLYHLH